MKLRNQIKRKKVLVLGVSGMLGHKVFEILSKNKFYNVLGSVRKKSNLVSFYPKTLLKNLIEVDIDGNDIKLGKCLLRYKPDTIINCIGIIKQNDEAKNLRSLILINALFPHQLADICSKINTRLITISTDCVFDGQKGESYSESDLPTCHDAYGMTKYLGEINYNKHLTLRTSFIGHELSTNISLLEWFLTVNEKEVKGYKRAIFSGFTSLEFSKLLSEKIIPNSKLYGLYQISTYPISKYDLLTLIAKEYKKEIGIIPDEDIFINRSLISDNIKNKIDYTPPKWETLITNMHKDFLKSEFYKYKRKKYEKIKIT